ncbi:hypothetical protein GCM10018785_46370 [Streptomyces longispororuber]|uniref:Uncharacterized protein n=1 Tax=Streptomyces longispororuber TaxID=68230 RepID=A0A918ZVN3_9ACTN|nr:beta-ketoacyl synthase N-terminal-like domain-containing protein [Streptomyces longispororuber]GHE72918.1 hypothetical protein GCM10018785_46370 [Streptomyces longispororuber]
MKKLLLDFLWSHLCTLGAFRESGRTPEAAREAAGLAPGYGAWFDESLRVLEGAGYIERQGGRILLDDDAPRHRPVEQLWREWETAKPAWQENPDLAATHLLVETALRAFPDILSGRRPATEVLFPGGSLELVQNAYETNPASAFFNQVLAADLMARLRRRPLRADGARILEIGAGTGATSAVVLEALRSARLDVREYCYTDISRAFLNHAERSFGAENPSLTCAILDIERPVAAQGLTLGGHDVVIAANVLHATRDIRHTLRNAKALLKPGGLLVLNELTANNLLSQFSFGLLDGWWRYEDPYLRIPGSPLLSTARWRHVLTQEGFQAIALPAQDAEDLGQQIIVAESDGVIRQATAVPRPSAPYVAPVRESPARAAADPGAGSEPGDRLRAHIEAVALDVLAEALDIPRTRIGRVEPFSDYGLDSIFAVNVARALGGTLGIDLDITVLFEHNTLAELGEFIVCEYADDLRDVLLPQPPSPDRAPDPAQPQPRPQLEIQPQPEIDEAALDGMAIVGMAARFPGADDVDAFWRIVEQGRRCITAPPEERADWACYGDEAAELRGGFLDGVHEFDPLFFRMSMTEARQVTPELRLLLMTAWNAVEDAGYRPAELRTRPTGVFVAATQSEYRPAAMDLMSLPSPAMVPNRISYLLDLNGPSEQCDTTCSSSFVALHRAIRSIRDGECEQALVGGVNLVMSPAGFGGMRAAGMLSPRGDVRPFQQGADGTARGEGVAAVLIKPLRRALEDGDVVHCVVRGTGVAHGGRGVSFTAPNIKGMKAAVAHAYADAGIDPGAVDYIETHGMSSMLADSAELAALGAGLRSEGDGDDDSEGDSDDVTYLGNVKPCIGHTEVVSGLAALVKTAQAMRHGVIPALPGFGRLHRGLSLKGTRLRVAERNLPWPERTDDAGRPLPRRASMHSFGIGGVNAHVVLEQHITSADRDEDPGAQVLVLSARSLDALRERARRLTHRLAEADPRSWADIAYTLQVGREAMSCRLAFVAQGTEDAARVLDGWLRGDPDTLARVAFADGVDSAAGAAHDGKPTRLDHVPERWAAGASIDWDLMHRGARRKRIALPGYPFARLTCFAEQAPRPDQAAHPGVGPVEGEAFVADLVASVLGLPRHEIDSTRSLADYGLNSLLLVAMLGRITRAFPGFRPEWWQPHDTLNDVIARLPEATAPSTRGPAPELVRLNGVTEGRPVFWIHGALAGVESYRTIAERIDRPFYGIQARGLLTEDAPIEGVTAMAEYYTEVIRQAQPQGPYDVGGFCLGGIVAYEVTRRLQAQGQDVASLTMVDSPDETGLAKSNANGFQSAKSAALQVVNSLLWPAGEKDPAVLRARLVHRDEVAEDRDEVAEDLDEVGEDLDEDAFVARLAELAAERGLAMPPAQIARFVRRNMAIQLAYRLGEHAIRPLPRPEAVLCTYFRNRRGLFLGEVAPYFQVAGETFSLDHVNYQQDWERELPGLRLVEIDAANHMTILNDAEPLAAIEETCLALYASEEIGATRG